MIKSQSYLLALSHKDADLLSYLFAFAPGPLCCSCVQSIQLGSDVARMSPEGVVPIRCDLCPGPLILFPEGQEKANYVFQNVQSEQILLFLLLTFWYLQKEIPVTSKG